MPTSDPDKLATLRNTEDPTMPMARPERAPVADPIADAKTLVQAPDETTQVQLELPPVADQGFGDRYDYRALLGEGGMGQVRLCRDARIGRDVAVKVIRKGAGSRSDLRSRFLREARVQGQLEHPAIVPVYDLGVADDGTYFTMRRVRGHTLEQVVDGLHVGRAEFKERYTLRRLLAAFNQAALAVAYAHARGVLHRDLKPSNVMLGDFGEVYVLDWGLAKLLGETEAPNGADVPPGSETIPALDAPDAEPGTTAVGAIMGTPGFMSPEQARGETDALDARTDVYALGAILFELLALEPLHPPYSTQAALSSTLAGADARASVRAPARSLPPELDAVCVRATSLDREHRYATVREMVDEIERFLEGDRDLARRRELAALHVGLAETAVARAKSPGDAIPARAEALRELNRAIALDPTHEPAVQGIARLLLTPPEQPPPEAEAALARSLEGERRETAREGAMGFLVWVLLSPLLALVGIRSPAAIAGAVGMTLFSALASLYLWRRARPVTNGAAFSILVLSSTAIACLSFYASPFVLVPAIAAQNTLVFAMHSPRGRWRLGAIGVGLVAVLAPLLLELCGLLPRSFAFRAGEMVLLPRMVDLPEAPTIGLLIVGSVVGVIVPCVVVTRLQDAAHEARRRVFTHLWHLDQLLPDRARAAG